MGYIHHHTRPCPHPDRRDSPPRTRHGGKRTAVPKGAMTGANAWIHSLVPVERSERTGGDWSGMERREEGGSGGIPWENGATCPGTVGFETISRLGPSIALFTGSHWAPSPGGRTTCHMEARRWAVPPVHASPGRYSVHKQGAGRLGVELLFRWTSCSPNRAPFPHGDADSPRRSDGACDCGMYSIDCGRKARPQARPFSCVCVCSRREGWQSSRLRRCDLVRITCQIPDRDVMRRSTIEVPLARGLRDGGDGVVRTIAQAPSAGITPLHSHYPSLCCAAWRDTSCGSVAPLLTLPGCLPRQAALLGILQPRKSLVSCDAALPRPAGRCRAET